jgi:hypothetical protein
MSAEPTRNSFRASVLRGEKPPIIVADKNRRHDGEDALDGDLVHRAEKRSSNHRSNDRHRLSGEVAAVVHEGRSDEVELINLSSGGAMIRGALDLMLWDLVELKLGDSFGIEAAVRWIRDDQFGLEFAHETRVEGDPIERATMLLDVIRRSFDDQLIDFVPDEAFAAVTVPEAGINDRIERRHPLIWVGEVHHAHDSHQVRLRNVSEGGALIDVTADYPVGAEVMLDLGEAGQFFATIAWACGDQAGLSFKEPFDIGCLAMARPQLMPSNWQAPTFLDSADADSPWDKKWSRCSLAEIANELEGYLKR